ncbi:MAG: glycosyltransferase [Patescibacteria group bacterium]
MKKPKIALAHEFLNTIGGAEQVLIQLHHTFPDAPIYTLTSNPNFVNQYLPNAKIITSPLKYFPSWLTNHHQLFLLYFPIATELFDFSDYDILISDSNSFIKGAITKPSTIHVSYIHSPTRYVWDQSHEWINQKKLNLFAPIINWRFNQLRIWDKLAADRVDVMLANSKYVGQRIEKYYRRTPYKVIYPSIDTSSFHPPENLKKSDYYLVLSRLQHFKRFDLAILACNRLKKRLIVAGDGDAKKHLESLAGPTIEFLGQVSDTKKIELMQSAKAFIFPGEEDFGIVPVEAMAAGTPVLAYKTGGLLESVRENFTGLFFERQTVEDVVVCIKNFEKNQSRFSAKGCINHAKKFDHQLFRREFFNLVEEIYLDKSKFLHPKSD